MAEPFLAEIRLMSFDFAPKGLGAVQRPAPADQPEPGALLLLGTTFGGDGRVTFALPDLRGRVPIHVGNGHTLGERGGEQAHTLTVAELPTHTHVMQATTATGDTPIAAGQRARATRPASSTPRPAQPHLADPDQRHQHRRQPGAPEHAAVPDAELLHRPAWHLPEPELRSPTMAQPFVGEIRMFAGNFAPAGWVFCDGQLLPISENEALFTLIGTTYGGDGREHLRAARPAGPDPDPPGQRLHPGGDGRRRGRSR